MDVDPGVNPEETKPRYVVTKDEIYDFIRRPAFERAMITKKYNVLGDLPPVERIEDEIYQKDKRELIGIGFGT